MRLGAGNEDEGSARRHRWNVQHDPPRNVPQHENFARHPVRATDHEASRVREIANEGESPATPATLVGVAFIVSIATVLMLLAFGVAEFPS